MNEDESDVGVGDGDGRDEGPWFIKVMVRLSLLLGSVFPQNMLWSFSMVFSSRVYFPSLVRVSVPGEGGGRDIMDITMVTDP